MDEIPGAIQKVLQELNQVEASLLSGDHGSAEVKLALERISTAKIALGRAQLNIMRRLAAEGDNDMSVLMARDVMESCHHALVHNPFSWGEPKAAPDRHGRHGHRRADKDRQTQRRTKDGSSSWRSSTSPAAAERDREQAAFGRRSLARGHLCGRTHQHGEALGRAQMNVMRKLGQDGDADSSAFMATVPSELLSCHHTLVHNAFSWGDQAEA